MTLLLLHQGARLRAAPSAATPVRAEPARVSPEALAWLRHARLLSPHRAVAEARAVCDLRLDGSRYPVVDLVETVRGTDPARGVRRAILLTPAHAKAAELPYFPPAAPVSCAGSVLSFSSPVEVGNTLPEGRDVSFSGGGAEMRVVDGS